MAVLYTFEKNNDSYKIKALENLNVNIIFNNISIITVYVPINDSYTISNLSKDGVYTINIENENTEKEEEIINITYNLLNSIICDIYYWFFNPSLIYSNNKLTKEANQSLFSKGLFNKLLFFQNNYLQYYGENLNKIFIDYLSNTYSLYKCNLQNSLDLILNEEVINGQSSSNLIDIQLLLYWSSLYFLEKDTYTNITNEELDVLNQKFKYDAIISKLCENNIEISKLEELYTVEEVLENIEIYSFQFNDVFSNINNVDNIDLINEGVLHSSSSLEQGKEIQFNLTGRIGFGILSSDSNLYSNIIDEYGNDDLFDIAFDNANNILYFVSKQFYTPSELYFKLIKQ